LHGDVSALSPVDGGRAGILAGYMIADYLAQHVSRRRRTEPVPHEAWIALVTGADRAADLHRIADSAAARLRFRYTEQALERLVGEFGDDTAATELAELLSRQDRFEQAVDVLRRLLAVRPWDREVSRRLMHTQELWLRAEEIRPAATAGDSTARGRLREILADGGVCDDLRVRADGGDTIAAEQLVERLVGRGCLRELRERADRGYQERADRGYQYAAEALADLYVVWGEVDLLQARANRGDPAAELRLSKVRAEGVSAGGTGSEVAKLRAAAGGDPDAARQLCTVLFELRDVDGLRSEVEAGTHSAADLLIALHTAQENIPPEQLAYLRAFGLTADGKLVIPGSEPMTFEKDYRWPTT
jgi:tetratricopeptide (TPR) repeat protein